MRMENSILSPIEGKIKAANCKKRQVISTSDILVEFFKKILKKLKKL